MATRTDNEITLSHEDADAVARTLTEYARAQMRHARQTRSAVVASQCERDAQKADGLARQIIRQLWTWN